MNTPDEITITKVEPDQNAGLNALVNLEIALTDFAKKFHTSATRWEFMVYPAMFVFGILGISGFWLIYSLTRDMHNMSLYIDPLMASNLATMSRGVENMTASVASMNQQVARMADKMENMDRNMATISETMNMMQSHTSRVAEQLHVMQPLLKNMTEMNNSMKFMTTNTAIMSRDINTMGRPMSIMQGVMPW